MIEDDAIRLAGELATLTLERLRGGAALPAPAAPPVPLPDPDREWMGAAEMAAHLGMTRGALYAATERGQIPAHRVGKRGLRFRKSEVERALAARRIGAPLRAIETARNPIKDDPACAVARKGGGR